MKNFLLFFLLFVTFSALADDQVIRCSLRANYEIYRGEGLVERGEGSLIAVPVEFNFFTNDSEFAANFTGSRATLRVKAKANDNEARVEITGVTAATFFPKKGLEQLIERDQLTTFNYTYGPNRVVFLKAALKCLPSVLWDNRPVSPRD